MQQTARPATQAMNYTQVKYVLMELSAYLRVNLMPNHREISVAVLVFDLVH